MFQTAHAATADNLWLQTLAWFSNGTASTSEGGRGRPTTEVLHAALSLSDPRQRWIASREPAMNPAFALAEVIWILQARDDSAFLNFFNPQLPKYAGEGSNFHGAYGHRLRQRFGFDQLRRAADVLRANPGSRQVVLQIWDAANDLPTSEGTPRSKDIPCNITSVLKVRNHRLEWTQVMRSNDLIRGLPHNIVQFSTIQEVMAGWLGLDVGSYNHLSDSLHIYADELPHIAAVQRQPLPLNQDDLRILRPDSEETFARLERHAEQLIDVRNSASELFNILANSIFPTPYRNWLAILVADACRRRKDLAAACAAAEICTNSSLSFLWNRWMLRNSS